MADCGPEERIPQRPASLMLNFWHTNDWPVEGVPGSIEAPTIPFQTQFDWVSYTPEVSSAIRPRRVPSAVHKTSAVVDLQGRLFEKAPGKGFFLEKR